MSDKLIKDKLSAAPNAMSLPATQALSQMTSVERTRKLSILLKHHKILVRFKLMFSNKQRQQLQQQYIMLYAFAKVVKCEFLELYNNK